MKHKYITSKKKIVELQYFGKYTVFTNEDGSISIRRKVKNYYFHRYKRKYIYIPVTLEERNAVLLEIAK